MCEPRKIYISTKQAAQALNVSESSIKRWIDDGSITAIRTPGGHRRITLENFDHFLQTTGLKVVNFQHLGLDNSALTKTEEGISTFAQSLLDGDIFALRQSIQRTILSGASSPQICDELIYPAFQKVRQQCSHPSEECRVLHRAIELIRRLLHEITRESNNSKSMKIVFADIGYEVDALPTYLAQYVVSERTTPLQLGAQVPLEVLVGALKTWQPKILWISASGPFAKKKVDAYMEKLLTHIYPTSFKTVFFGNLHTPKNASDYNPRSFSDFSAYIRGLEAHFE